ncbi:LysR family transcriptional regulator [Tropicibacter sp. S64]|uniref:LysR family transcriptional regulator n=1 Tax=Tropicibacter sp. S64 TaxID=3415122 RepID=UPI003C7ED3B0
MPTDLMTLDFSALRTLCLVHAHGSVSRSAEAMGVAQSTVSYTLTRLRGVFGDPLFVRQGQGIVPTPRCSDIVLQAGALLDRFEELAAPQAFDPRTAALDVRISCNYYERVTIIPEVMRVLRREAPGITVKIISSTVLGKRQLTRSESDILIGPIQIEDAGYYKRALFTEEYVCIMDPANPLARAPMSVETYVNAPQVIVNYGGNFRSRFLTVMESEGYAPNTVMEVPSPANLDAILLQTDMIATVPTRIADAFRETMITVPCPFPASIPIDMFWTARTHTSAPHQWLRATIAAAAGSAARRDG